MTEDQYLQLLIELLLRHKDKIKNIYYFAIGFLEDR